MKSCLAFCTVLTLIAPPVKALAADVVRVVSEDSVNNPRQPQAAVGPAGTIYVTFGSEETIYCSKSTDGGNSYGQPSKIGDVDGLALGRRRGPRIVAGSDVVVVTAISHDSGNLFSWRSTDEGRSWNGPTQVNDSPKDSREGLHAMAISPKGDIYCTWLDLRSGETEIFGSLLTDDGRTWRENQLVYHSPSGSVCECCHPSATYDTDGNLYVMWRNSVDGHRDMYVAVSENGGQTFGKASRLGTEKWKLNACPMDGGWLAATAKGQLTTVWRREKQIFRTDSARPGEQRLGTGLQPWVAGTPQGAHIVWVDRNDGVLWLASPGELRPKILANEATDPVIVAPTDGAGPIVVAWQTGQQGRTEIKTFTVER